VVDTVFDPFGYDVPSWLAFTMYPDSTSPVPIIKDEELLLIRAEAKLRMGDLTGALADINSLRAAHGMAALAPLPSEGMLREILYQRRYSLLFEGHRWIDMRRVGTLGALPLDVPEFTMHPFFPFPSSECRKRTPPPSVGCEPVNET
jgi:hypothetical protein